MAGAHLAHNVEIGNNVIIANNALLAGYVRVGDRAFISGGVVIHQFVTIGRLAMLRGNGRFSMDIPPFVVALERNCVEGVNLVGLRRAGLAAEVIREIKEAYRIFYLSGLPRNRAVAALEEAGFLSAEAREFIDFVRGAQRPLVQHIRRAKG